MPSRRAGYAIQGRADPSVAFDGNEHLQSSRATEEMWRSLNGCAPGVVSTLPARSSCGTAPRSRGGRMRAAADVATSCGYEIEGGGHRWPPETVSHVPSQRENGVSSQNLDASEVIWAFLSTHARR